MTWSLGIGGGLGRRERLRGLPIGPVAAVAAALVLALPAAAAGSEPAVATAVAERPEDVRAYWTEQRMRSARPVEHLLDRVRNVPREAGELGRGDPSVVLPSRPGDADSSAGLTDSLLPGGGGQSASAAAQVSRSSSYPARTHGKVFFTVPGRGNFVCSGTAVRSPGRSLVLTAGHCVYDDGAGRFVTNWMFVPGYRDGRRPFGEWPARRLATTSQFRSRGALSHDVGFAAVARNANGRGVEDRVGARGIAFNQPRDQFYRVFGYPARSPYNGQRLYRCDSPYRGADRSAGSPPPMRIDCDMTAGSSGGGWVVNAGFVASVVSYAYECTGGLPLLPCNNPEQGKLFGPYFGNAIRHLYRANRGRARLCAGRPATYRGGGADDLLTGSNGADVIHAGGGDDILRGRRGDDRLCGGAGDDRINTGRGSNRVRTGPGNDIVRAGARGRNRISALKGRNRIRCGPGRDRVVTNRLSRVNRACNVVVRR